MPSRAVREPGLYLVREEIAGLGIGCSGVFIRLALPYLQTSIPSIQVSQVRWKRRRQVADLFGCF